MARLRRTRNAVDAALEHIAQGFTPRSACGATGVSYRTLLRWRQECEENEQAFEDAFNQGLALDEKELRRAFEDNPHLRMQYLFRKHADLSAKQHVEVKQAVAIKVEHSYAPQAIDAFYDSIGEVRGQLDAPAAPDAHVLAEGRVIDEGATEA